ncbi:hypothetical protein [Fluviicola sp.]|uniref:hypothetical protein n=1 Tax=Fluviicola sp. TaxID=1917219 RepID=UPI00261880E1|nr:hypothetical protein [Fluviicola sp.]
MKNLKGKDQIYRNVLETESYSIEFNWDEFVVSRKATMSKRAGIEPDAHIRLVHLSENLTRVDVKLKFSEIVWMILVFVQLGIIAVTLFGPFNRYPNIHWWSRILIMIGGSALWNFIIWLIFVSEVKTLENVIRQVFEDLIFLSHKNVQST